MYGFTSMGLNVEDNTLNSFYGLCPLWTLEYMSYLDLSKKWGVPAGDKRSQSLNIPCKIPVPSSGPSKERKLKFKIVWEAIIPKKGKAVWKWISEKGTLPQTSYRANIWDTFSLIPLPSTGPRNVVVPFPVSWPLDEWHMSSRPELISVIWFLLHFTLVGDVYYCVIFTERVI